MIPVARSGCGGRQSPSLPDPQKEIPQIEYFDGFGTEDRAASPGVRAFFYWILPLAIVGAVWGHPAHELGKPRPYVIVVGDRMAGPRWVFLRHRAIPHCGAFPDS